MERRSKLASNGSRIGAQEEGKMRHSKLGRAVAVFIGLTAACVCAGPAAAQKPSKNCYEEIGCPWKQAAPLAAVRGLSCENLAHIRNRLYHENGYCFRSKATRDLYGNAGCRYPLQGLVPLNRYERANIATSECRV